MNFASPTTENLQRIIKGQQAIQGYLSEDFGEAAGGQYLKTRRKRGPWR